MRKATILLFWLAVNGFSSPAPLENPRTVSTDSSPSPRARPDTTPVTDLALNEFGAWAGGSFYASTLAGSTQDAKFGILGLRYTRVLTARKRVTLKYTVDAIPAALLSYPKVEVSPTGPDSLNFVAKRTRAAVYGAGLAPLGLQLNFRYRERVQPFIGLSGGFLYFAAPIPDRRGTQFNFTADWGGGVQIFIRPRRALTVGYKYHHLSNGNRGLYNPGFDSNVFFAGLSIFK